MSVELLNKINNILITKWDPIGVSDLSDADDEYYSYAFYIFSKYKDLSILDIYNYLNYLEQDQIGCSVSDESRILVATEIYNLTK